MKKVKRMALGGVSKAAKNAAAKALVPPPKIQTMANLSGASTVTAPPKIQTMANLPRGSTVAGSSVGKSPLDGLKNLPKMSGPLGKAGTTGGQNLPKGMLGLGAALGKNPGINTTTTADMTRKSNAKPFSSAAGQRVVGDDILNASGRKIGAIGPRLFGMKEGGKVSSASSRADGCATKGKTKGKMV